MMKTSGCVCIVKITQVLILLVWIIGLPAVGLLLTGELPHFTFPPIPTQPGLSSFSPIVFGILLVLITATLTPFNCHFSRTKAFAPHHTQNRTNLPWWGWIAIGWTACVWIIAWNRFSWFEAYQPHTFPLLWFGYIVLLNAFTLQRSGQCLLLHRPWLLTQLFLLSSGFWWTYEFLNQYVNNWHYVNLPETEPFEYFFYTSLSFSTVLPAVMSTYEWLATFPRLTQPFSTWYTFPWITNVKTGWILLALGSIGLGLIGIWPTLLFPLLWVCPLCLLFGVQCLRKEQSRLSGLAQGDWLPLLLSALAALVCGFWWELWNVYSLVHWEYTLPYVHAFKIFEMPVLGYAGYLPFGLTCLVITEFVLRYQSPMQRSSLPRQRKKMCNSHEGPEA